MSSSDEEDIHECGRCKELFFSLVDYLKHKRLRVCRKSSKPSHLVPDAPHTSATAPTAGSGQQVAASSAASVTNIPRNTTVSQETREERDVLKATKDSGSQIGSSSARIHGELNAGQASTSSSPAKASPVKSVVVASTQTEHANDHTSKPSKTKPSISPPKKAKAFSAPKPQEPPSQETSDEEVSPIHSPPRHPSSPEPDHPSIPELLQLTPKRHLIPKAADDTKRRSRRKRTAPKKLLDHIDDDLFKDLEPVVKKRRGRPPKADNIPEHIKKRVVPSVPTVKTFVCPICDYSSHNDVEFDRHMRRVHSMSKHCCEKCHKAFGDQYKLKRHQTTCQQIKEEVMEDLSSYGKFDKSNKLFFKVEKDKDQEDEGDEVEDEEEIDRAENDDNVIQVVDFSCQECSTECATYDDIQEHVKMEHRKIIPGICRFCGRWFKTKHHLWRHLTSSLHDNISDSELKVAKEELKKIQKVVWNKKGGTRFNTKVDKSKHTCLACGKQCASLAYLDKHMKRVHGVVSIQTGAHKCYTCFQLFKSRASLNKHMEKVHRTTDRMPCTECNVCSRAFRTSTHVTRHLENLHTPRIQGPLQLLLALEQDDRSNGEETVLKQLYGKDNNEVDDEDRDTKNEDRVCFVCKKITMDPENFKEHMQEHRVWMPHPEKGSIPPDLFSSELTPPPFTIERQKLWYKSSEESTSKKSLKEGQKKGNPRRLNTIDQEVFTNLIHEIHKVNKTLDRSADEENDTEDNLIIDSAEVQSEGSKSGEQQKQEDKQNICMYCFKTCDTLDDLYQHKIEDHSLVLMYRCCVEDCNQAFSHIAAYKDHHFNIHSQAAFICSLCNEHVETMNSLTAHKQSRHYKFHRMREDNFYCHICDKKFSNKAQFDQHVAQNKSHFKCPTCGKIFRKRGELENHKTSHEKKLTFLCEECGSSFHNRVALGRHKLTHSETRKFTCELCESTFNKKEHLQRHLISKHSDDKPFVCSYPGCEKSFKRKDKLKEHFKVHSDDKKHVCQVCGRRYRYREGLNYHMKTHENTDAKKYTCSECGISTTRPSQLKQHMVEMHGISVKESHVYRCVECDATFSRPERVKRHMEKEHAVKADWSAQCKICNRGFAGHKSLENHMQTKHADPKTPKPNVTAGSEKNLMPKLAPETQPQGMAQTGEIQPTTQPVINTEANVTQFVQVQHGNMNEWATIPVIQMPQNQYYAENNLSTTHPMIPGNAATNVNVNAAQNIPHTNTGTGSQEVINIQNLTSVVENQSKDSSQGGVTVSIPHERVMHMYKGDGTRHRRSSRMIAKAHEFTVSDFGSGSGEAENTETQEGKASVVPDQNEPIELVKERPQQQEPPPTPPPPPPQPQPPPAQPQPQALAPQLPPNEPQAPAEQSGIDLSVNSQVPATLVPDPTSAPILEQPQALTSSNKMLSLDQQYVLVDTNLQRSMPSQFPLQISQAQVVQTPIVHNPAAVNLSQEILNQPFRDPIFTQPFSATVNPTQAPMVMGNGAQDMMRHVPQVVIPYGILQPPHQPTAVTNIVQEVNTNLAQVSLQSLQPTQQPHFINFTG